MGSVKLGDMRRPQTVKEAIQLAQQTKGGEPYEKQILQGLGHKPSETAEFEAVYNTRAMTGLTEMNFEETKAGDRRGR